MPKLYTSDEFHPQESIAVVKKLDGQAPDAFVNIHQDTMDKPCEDKKEAEVNLVGDYYFSPLPRKIRDKWPFALYISGQKGAGKTQNAVKWMNNMRQICPKNNIFFISSKKEDRTIDREFGEKNMNRIPTEKFADDSDHIPTIEDFEDCLVVFDDFMRDDNVKRIHRLLEILVERGRDRNISVIAIFHNITNSHSTKLILTESDYYLIFPKLLSNHAFRYFGKSYANIDDKRLLQRIKREAGNQCLIAKNPKYVVTPQSVFLPDELYDS